MSGDPAVVKYLALEEDLLGSLLQWAHSARQSRDN